jgi:hypothetical protein
VLSVGAAFVAAFFDLLSFFSRLNFASVSLPGCLPELEFVFPNPGGMLEKGVGIVKFTTRPRKCERTVLVCFAWLVFFL